jgi:hypothetical protein
MHLPYQPVETLKVFQTVLRIGLQACFASQGEVWQEKPLGSLNVNE